MGDVIVLRRASPNGDCRPRAREADDLCQCLPRRRGGLARSRPRGMPLLDFSICIATYNRAHRLSALFQSLERLNGATFEAVVVDDGSSDDTFAELRRLAGKAPFPVRFDRVLHGGKCAALNRIFDLARGRFLLMTNDDDRLQPQVLSDALSVWNSIPEKECSRYCSVTGLAADPDGNVIGKRFTNDVEDGDFFHTRIVGQIRGDKCEVVLRSAIGNWRFPTREGEYRLAENMLWFHLAKNYKTRFVNRVWTIKEYLPDGLTANGLRDKVASANLTALYNETALKLFPEMPLPLRLKFTLDFMRYAAHGHVPPIHRLERLNWRPLAILALPIGEFSRRNDLRRLARKARQ